MKPTVIAISQRQKRNPFFSLVLRVFYLLMFVKCIGPDNLFAQVNIAYADTMMARAQFSGLTSYTLYGKRIMNLDTLTHQGRLLQFSNCSNINISNCIFGPSADLALYFYNCTNVTISNCIFLDVVSALTFDGGDNIKVNYNQFMNMTNNAGRWGNPKGDRGCCVQISHITNGSGFQVNYNVAENMIDYSNPEDLVNVGGSSFSSPMQIIGNRFRGYGPSWHGSGINSADDGDSTDPNATIWPITGPINVKNNILYNAGAIGIWVTAQNSVFEDNIVYGESRPYSNAGLAVGSSRVACPTITIQRNKINFLQGLFGSTAPNHIWAPGCLSNITWGTGADANIENATIDESVLPRKLLGSFLASYHKLDNDWNDYSGSHLDATPHGTTIVCDNVRKAATFNGTSSDWAEVTRSPYLRPNTQKISVSAWIKPSSLSNYQGIMRSQDGGGWTEGWRMVMDNSTFVARVVTDNGPVSVYCGGVSANQWNQVSFTYDGRILKGYVNGSPIDSAVLSGNIIYSNSEFGMAIGGSEGTYNFSGMIAEVKVWYGDLSDAEIYTDWYTSAGLFDGSISNPNLTVSATYSANGQSKVLDDFDGVLANSNGQIVTNNWYSINTWTLVSGNPNYEYSFGGYDYISIPNMGAVQMKLSVAQGYCMLPAWRIYTIWADNYQLFKTKIIPGTGEVIISKSTGELSSFQPLLPGNKRIPVPSNGSYHVRIINTLGQIVKTGVYANGELKLNIGNALSGVYVVQIFQGGRMVYSEKIIK